MDSTLHLSDDLVVALGSAFTVLAPLLTLLLPKLNGLEKQLSKTVVNLTGRAHSAALRTEAALADGLLTPEELDGIRDAFIAKKTPAND